MRDNIDYDRGLFRENPPVRYLIGIDEAGRGPLAGPLSVGLFVTERDGVYLEGVDDSKKMSAPLRERMFREITGGVSIWKNRLVSPRVIDKYNIYEATKRTMTEMVMELDKAILRSSLVITDAMPLDLPLMRQLNPAKGDALSYTVGCASVIAKVLRDREMVRLDGIYPGYGFAGNKGYGTRQHLEALGRLGPTSEHRRSFAPVKKYYSAPEYDLFYDKAEERKEE